MTRVGRDRQAGPAGGPGRRAMDALLRRRQPWLVRADLADDPGPDARLADPVGRLAHELVGQVVDGAPVDQRLGRVVRRRDTSRSPSRCAARLARASPASQPGSRPTPGSVRSTRLRPAGVAERGELVEDHRLVAGQLPVVPADRGRATARSAVCSCGSVNPSIGRVDRAEDRLDVGHGRAMLRRRRAGSVLGAGRGRG